MRNRYRTACEALIFANFEYASAHEIEQKLWAAHLKVNIIFRQEHKLVRWIGKNDQGSTNIRIAQALQGPRG